MTDVTDACLGLRDRRPLLFWIGLGTFAWLLGYPALDLLLQRVGVTASYPAPVEFGAYYGAARRFVAGAPLYAVEQTPGLQELLDLTCEGDCTGERAALRHLDYLYPPIFVLAVVPFTVVPFTVAALLWNVVSLAVLWVGLLALLETYDVRLEWWERVALLWLLLGFQPIVASLKVGQASTLLAAMFAFAAAFFERGRRAPSVARTPLLSGVFTALGSVVKPFYAVSGAHLLHDRRRLVGAVATGVVVVVGSLAVFGPGPHLKYLSILAAGEGWGVVQRPLRVGEPGVWHPGVYKPLYVLGTWSLPVRFLLLAGVVALLLRSRPCRAETERPAFVLGLAAIPLLAPVAHALEFCSLVPAAVVALRDEFGRPAGRPVVVPVAVLLLSVQVYAFRTFIYLADAVAAFAWLRPALPVLQPGLAGNLLLFGLATYRVAGLSSIRSGEAAGSERG
jgi:hypothetical protein